MTEDLDPCYLETLKLYYEEEIEGEAHFQGLAEVFGARDYKHKLTLLAEVERHAALSVAPLLDKYNVIPRSTAELVANGQAEARAMDPDWGRLMAQMNATYPGYLEVFRALERMAPPEDRRLLSFLTQHEVAVLAFLSHEAAHCRDSTVALRDYLATQPENWNPEVA